MERLAPLHTCGRDKKIQSDRIHVLAALDAVPCPAPGIPLRKRRAPYPLVHSAAAFRLKRSSFARPIRRRLLATLPPRFLRHRNLRDAGYQPFEKAVAPHAPAACGLSILQSRACIPRLEEHRLSVLKARKPFCIPTAADFSILR